MGPQSNGLRATGRTQELVGRHLALPLLEGQCALCFAAYVPGVAHVLFVCVSFFFLLKL